MPGDLRLSTLSLLFVSAFGAGMFVRYHPTAWQNLLRLETGDRVLNVLRRSIDVIEQWVRRSSLMGTTAFSSAPTRVPLKRRTLAFLRGRFSENTSSHGWPGDNQYRFERGDARLLIWDSESQADWWVSATTETSLASLVRELWGCAALPRSLYSNDPRGESVLQSIRSE
jgi:hypothetical protein